METKNIYQRLHAAMEQVGYVQKEQKKPGMQYTFASHDGVTAAVRPALLANGIVPTVSVKQHSQDGNRTEVVLTVRFVNIDTPSDFVEADAFGYGIDPQDKGPGKAISYAFKYCLLKTLCLETGDDPERDQIPHENEDTKRDALVASVASTAVRLFNTGDKAGAFNAVQTIAMDDDATEAKLKLWSLLGPHSALRSFIKQQQAALREAAHRNQPETEEA